MFRLPGQSGPQLPATDTGLTRTAASLGNRAPAHGARLARRCPGRASGKAAAHKRQPQRAERAICKERAEAFFLCLIAGCRSLQIALGKPSTLSSLADERHVSSLLRSTAARDPVRATTTAADSRGSCRRSPKQIARAQRAPAPAASCVQEEMAEQRFSVPPDPTKTAASWRTSQRAERAIEHSAMREQL
jgi:hypothetical protein